jgi:hypothetical protein
MAKGLCTIPCTDKDGLRYPKHNYAGGVRCVRCDNPKYSLVQKQKKRLREQRETRGR